MAATAHNTRVSQVKRDELLVTDRPLDLPPSEAVTVDTGDIVRFFRFIYPTLTPDQKRKAERRIVRV
ncbi:MAG: hypothetical protein ACK443_03305 [Methylococcaceae bacterium]